MSVKLGSNIASLVSQRRLEEATGSLSRIYERLSSGQRINRASDDAAGLAIADSLNAKSRVYAQGIRNGNDGISLLTIADSAIAELTGVVTRIRELSEQAANGSYSNRQRQALDAEAQQLSKEFTRIAQTTSFNGIKVFDGSLGNGLYLQLGEGTGAVLNAAVGGDIGTGEFNEASSYTTQSANRAAVLGDVNGDGILDLVSAGYSGRIDVQLGAGDGSFGAAVSYTSSSYADINAVVLGDLNGDGILDLISSGADNRMELRFGQGNGSFGTASIYTLAGSYNQDLALRDLNNDGVLDLVVAGGSNRIEVMLGQGNGSFGASTIYTTASMGMEAIALGDLNGDGIFDLISAGGGYTFEVRIGLGDGKFGTAAVYTSGSYNLRDLNLGDLNGDGVLDLVTSGANQRSEVWLGRGDGSFGEATVYGSDNYYDLAAALGDLNGDGVLDLVTVGYNSQTQVRLGHGDGSFGDMTTYTGSSTIYDVALGDLNGDGVLDILTVESSSNVVQLAKREDGLAALASFSLKTRTDALQAMGMLDTSISKLARQRGQIGASLSRVGVAISNLQSSAENFKAAESRIRDTDIASDAAQLIRTQILQQAASSVLSQANQAPSLALKLLT